MPDLCVLGMEFENTIAIIEIRTLEFVSLQSFVQNQKSLNLEPKMSYQAIFGMEFKNNNAAFEHSALEFVYLQNFAKE